jgi:hypothetical protein
LIVSVEKKNIRKRSSKHPGMGKEKFSIQGLILVNKRKEQNILISQKVAVQKYKPRRMVIIRIRIIRCGNQGPFVLNIDIEGDVMFIFAVSNRYFGEFPLILQIPFDLIRKSGTEGISFVYTDDASDDLVPGFGISVNDYILNMVRFLRGE